MTNADRQTGQHPSGSRDDMLKHLWRSLTEFRRRPRLTPAEKAYWLQTEQYKVQSNLFALITEMGEQGRQALDALRQASR